MNTGRGVLRTWWLAVALLLVGVGLILPAQAQEKAPAVQQTGEPTQPQAAPQDPDPARAARRAQRRAQRQAQAEAGQAAFEIDVRAPADVRDVIARRLELRRFAELTDLDDGELLRLLPTARTNAEEILATLGFFSPTVRVEAVAATDSSPRRIVIDADPGEPTLVTEVNIAFTGPIATDETARGQRVRIEALWPLRTGMQFTQAGWDAAKLVALRELTTVHHPNGRIADSRADIDPETRSARLQITLDSGPVFKFGKLVITGLDRRIEWVNPGFERITGYTVAELHADPGLLHAIVHPEDRARVRAESEAALASGARYDTEHRILRPDGADGSNGSYKSSCSFLSNVSCSSSWPYGTNASNGT